LELLFLLLSPFLWLWVLPGGGTALAVDLAFAFGSAFFARALAGHFAMGAFGSAFFARALAEHFAMGFS